MAGRQVHIGQVGHIPGIYDNATRIGIVFYLVDGLADLIYVTAPVIGPGAPLVAVDMSQITVFVGPFIPDAHSVFL